jgi:hypothetical protein
MGKEMTKKKEVVGYSTEDEHIYCVECINKDREIMEKIEKAITAENSEESLYFCDLCEKQIKSIDLKALFGREMVVVVDREKKRKK